MPSLIQVRLVCCGNETNRSNRFSFIIENTNNVDCGCKFIRRL